MIVEISDTDTPEFGPIVSMTKRKRKKARKQNKKNGIKKKEKKTQEKTVKHFTKP